MTLNLPTWMTRRIQELYPNLSTQAAIKHYLKANLDDKSNKSNVVRYVRSDKQPN